MKKLLLILLIFIGINCQAQNKSIFDQEVDRIQLLINNLEFRCIKTEIQNAYNDTLIFKLLCIVDSLQKRVIELENNCIVLKVDSVKHYYHTWDDSVVIEYEKRQYVAPFKKINKKQ